MSIKVAEYTPQKGEIYKIEPRGVPNEGGSHGGGHAGGGGGLGDAVAIATQPAAAYAAKQSRESYLRSQNDNRPDIDAARQTVDLQNQGLATANAAAEDQQGLAQREMSLQEQQAAGQGAMANREMSLKEQAGADASAKTQAGLSAANNAANNPENYDKDGRALTDAEKAQAQDAAKHTAFIDFAAQASQAAPNQSGVTDVSHLKDRFKQFYEGDVPKALYMRNQNGAISFFGEDKPGQSVELTNNGTPFAIRQDAFDHAAKVGDLIQNMKAGMPKPDNKEGSKWTPGESVDASGNKTTYLTDQNGRTVNPAQNYDVTRQGTLTSNPPKIANQPVQQPVQQPGLAQAAANVQASSPDRNQLAAKLQQLTNNQLEIPADATPEQMQAKIDEISQASPEKQQPNMTPFVQRGAQALNDKAKDWGNLYRQSSLRGGM